MLLQRVITTVILVPIVLSVIVFLDSSWIRVLVATILGLGAWEWARFAEISKTINKLVFIFLVTAAIAAPGLGPVLPGYASIPYIAAVFWLVVAVAILGFEDRFIRLFGSPLAKHLAGIVVLVPAGLSLVTLHQSGPIHLIFLLFLVWLADIFAYFSGRKWGRRKLSPRISPGKSWEGVIGGFIAGMLLAFFYALHLQLQLYDIIIFLFISALTLWISVTGDLFESQMKRSINLKDSSNILPGHGGILDRIDSLTASAPVYLVATSLTGMFT